MAARGLDRIECRVSVETEEQLKTVLSIPEVSLVYVDEACFSDASLMKCGDRIHEAHKKAGLRLRRIERSTDKNDKSRQQIVSHFDAVMVRSFEQVSENLQNNGSKLEKVMDYTVYSYNTEAAMFMKEMGADVLTYPIELSGKECQHLHASVMERLGGGKSLKFELLVYGHLPMMVSANCLVKTSSNCDHKGRVTVLKDRTGRDMPDRAYCKYCYNQLYNAEALVLYDLDGDIYALKPSSLRYDFTVESAAEVRSILSGAVPKGMTRGHFRHTVE